MKDSLAQHNDAVMTLLFLFFGAELIADGVSRWRGEAAGVAWRCRRLARSSRRQNVLHGPWKQRCC